MPNIANLSLVQLRSATKTQIITAIANYLTNNFTKRQIIAFLMDAELIPDEPVRTYRTDGQIESETHIDRDAETGALVSSRQVRWSYYPTGEVDTITVTEGATVRTIKHYLDGQQPTVTVQTQHAASTPAPTPHRSLRWLTPLVSPRTSDCDRGTVRGSFATKERAGLKLAALALVVIALSLLAFYLSR